MDYVMRLVVALFPSLLFGRVYLVARFNISTIQASACLHSEPHEPRTATPIASSQLNHKPILVSAFPLTDHSPSPGSHTST
jgi:hypothetical protein